MRPRIGRLARCSDPSVSRRSSSPCAYFSTEADAELAFREGARSHRALPGASMRYGRYSPTAMSAASTESVRGDLLSQRSTIEAGRGAKTATRRTTRYT